MTRFAPLLALAIWLAALASQAATNTWAPNGSGPSDASGNWLGGNDWWNGTAIVSGTWTSAGPDSAVFGAGTNGAYLVNLGGGQIFATNVTFNTSGYTLTNGSLTLETAGGNSITVAANVAATILGPVTNTSSDSFAIGGGGTLTLSGGAGMAGNTIAMGGGTVDFHAGTFSGVNFVLWLQTSATQEAATINTARLLVGYAGNSTYTINDPAALLVGTGGGANNALGRGGYNGTLVLEQGTVNMTATGNQMRLGFDNSGSSKGTLTIQGGAFNLGANAIYINYGGTGANNAGALNVSGGTLTTEGIQFGSGGTYITGSTAALIVSGGTLLLGEGGLSEDAAGNLAMSTVLSGGVIEASSAWSSSIAMTLSPANGGVTFDAADTAGDPLEISLSGVLSGAGGLTKAGGGTLTLSGANTYSGSTTNNAGDLAVTTASTGAGSYSIGGGAALDVQILASGASLNMSSLTLNAGSTLNLNLGPFGNPTAPVINISGALTPSSAVTINIEGTLTNAGQFTLIKYGSIGGGGYPAFVLGAYSLPVGTVGTVSLVNDTANNSVDLDVAITNVPQLVWDGTINGNWDTNGTANWKTNAYYTQTNGVGPAVIFNAAASGTNTAIVLNTTVNPATVAVSNSVLTYSLSGSGGIAGTGGLVKSGTGTFTLGCANSYTGGTEVDGGILAMSSTNNVPMEYVVNSGTLKMSVAFAGSSLPMTSLALGSSSPQLTVDFGNFAGSAAPALDIGGDLSMDGNVTVNVTNLNLTSTAVAVVLRYAGERSGSGSFVAGSVPAGITLVDDTAHQQVILYRPGVSLVIPSLNSNDLVVAAATPQQFGAYGDGVTDDSAAFQNAINAVYNSGGAGGGVVYVPAGHYAFYNSISLPTGVTLHGDWTDWTAGSNGLVGTTFNVFYGAGQSNAAPFINMTSSTALRDINIWYPNQNPANITAYPYTIGLAGDGVVQNVVLVNAYQGILASGAEFILSTVIGTPLYMGFSTAGTIADISQTEDVRFSPAVWPASLLPNAPTAGGSYATWMRTYGTGMQMFRLDGLINVNTYISGYNVGLDFEQNSGGTAGCAFYNGCVSNCATALLAQEMQTAEGLEISDFTLDGDTAVARTHITNEAAAEFDDCQIIGRKGTAVSCTGANWQSSMAFQNCSISNALGLAGPGVFNLVNCALTGSTQCVLSASANRAAFTGCTFGPVTNIVDFGNAATNLIIHGGPAMSNAMPVFNWTNVISDYATRQPARTNLFVATSYGATGNGVTDDTRAIQNALAAAGGNGGGLVYLPPGKYHLTNTLDVPAGVQLRGTYEVRHATSPGTDGVAKGAILQPYGGQGTTNGPPAVALEANAGLVGVTISYESQGSNCTPFPPAIQGRGGNIYIIGVQCPNPYYFADLDTYICTNHFIDMLDGWALSTGVHVGNGSSGSIVDCHANWTFWIDNSGSASSLQGAAQTPVDGFAMSNLQYYVLGNCSELFVKDFSIIENMYMHCSSENGQGPTVTGISAMCDATYQCFVFDSTAPCTFNDVNPEWLVSLNGGYPGLTNQAGVITTSNFQGTVRFFNSPMWGSHNHEYLVNGGDVGFELVHLWQFAFGGSQVNGGVFHLVNCGAFNVVDGGNSSSPYSISFGANSGLPGKTNEVIGCFSYNGWNIALDNVSNSANIWTDYALSNYTILNLGPVIIGDTYPDGLYQFEPASALTFLTYSPNGINASGVSVQLTATNLLGVGYSTNFNSTNGLAVSGTSTTRNVGLPLATNALYTAIIRVTDATGNRATNTVTFDTINPACSFEAEDFDYNGGSYLNNSVADAYAGLSGTAGIDFSNGIPGQGSANYRPQGLETEGAGDTQRLAYAGGLQDYDIGFANTGNWGNYTRSYPAGVFNIFMRAASPNALTTDSAKMSLVTGDGGTVNQTTVKLGTFSVPNTGNWQAYTWVPLKTNTTTYSTFTGGSVQTLRGTTDNGGYNVNFYILVTTNIQPPWMVSPAPPSGLTAQPGNAQVSLAWTASPDAISYTVMHSTTNGGPYTVIASNITALVSTDSGLTNGLTYYYVVTSVSALGQSSLSAQVSATPAGPVPLTVTSASTGQLTLSWPAGGTFSLMSSTNLAPGSWLAVTNSAVLQNDVWSIALPIPSNGCGFFRLQGN